MTTAISQVSDLNSLFNNIFEDAYFVVREESIAPRLVKVYTNGRGLQTRNISTYPTITPATVGEADDFSAPTLFGKTSVTTLTPAEIQSQVLITDSRLETDGQNVRGDSAIEMSRGVASKIDTDIFAHFTSFTGATIGASGSAMTWAYFFAAVSQLRNGNVPRPWYCVLHPYQWHDMAVTAAVAATVTNAPQFQDRVMQNFYQGSVVGIPIFVSSNVPTSGTDAYGAIFNPYALAYDIRRPMRLEPERDASKRAWELNMTSVYATGEWRPLFGAYLLSDITAPTG